MHPNRIPTATASASVADILERVLDKGIVIAGDIRVKLVDIELLTIQLRLVVCSIEKAKEIGMDWWNTSLEHTQKNNALDESVNRLASRLEQLEAQVTAANRRAG